MRDVDRIEPILEALRVAWEANPDSRLGQLVYNACRTEMPTPPCPPLFYCEDDVMLGGINRMAGTA